MQSFSPISLVIAGLVVLVVIALVWLFRGRLFGARLNMGGAARARQPRLGVVDAFDLDRQRQLVLIRRDNVEHLVMIGGPNDLLIEPAIIRVQPAAQGRDKDGPQASPVPPAVSMAGPPIAAPAPASAEPVMTTPPPLPAAATRTEILPPSVAAGQDVGVPASPLRTPPPFQPRQPLPLSTAPRPTPFRAPAAAASQPRPPLPNPRPSPLARVTSAANVRRDEPGSGQTPTAGDESGPRSPAQPEPPPAAPAPAPAPEAAPPIPPEPGPVTVAVQPAPEPPRPAPPAIPATLDTLESLEEEMAKLLGRSVGDRG